MRTLGPASPGLASLGLALAAVAALVLSACVTINIYFPAAAAEKAADKIIDEVWQIRQGQQPAESKPAPTEPAAPATP